MIGKLSWLLDAKKNEIKIIKADYLAWPKSRRPEHIQEILSFYEVGKTITVLEF